MTTSRSKTGIVIRSLVEIIPTGDLTYEYWIVTDPLTRKSVTRKEAYDYIEEHGLVEALSTEDGQVWDTADRAFRERYKGFIANNYIKFRHLWG